MSSVSRPLLLASLLAPAASAAVLDLPIWYRNTYADVEVQIGTPPTSHLLRFDTGSGTSWVLDQTCATECENFSGFPRSGYNNLESSTSGLLGTWGEIEYMGGDTAGLGIFDKFSFVTPSSSSNPISWNQSFVAASRTSWAQTAADGFLGLAFSSIKVANAPTVVETMLWDGLLDAPRFAIYYGTEFTNTGPNGDGSAPGDGILTIGGSKEETYVDVSGGNEEAKGITWIPLHRLEGETEHQVWRTKLLSLTGNTGAGDNGNGTAAAAATGDRTVEFPGAFGVFDTGAGLMYVPDSQVDAIYDAMGLWSYQDILKRGVVPLCSEFNSSWSVTLSFQGSGGDSDVRTLTMTGDELARPGYAGGREDACWPPFQGGNSEGFFLFGTSLLQKFYTIWDFGADAVENYNPQIGFGKLKEGF